MYICVVVTISVCDMTHCECTSVDVTLSTWNMTQCAHMYNFGTLLVSDITQYVCTTVLLLLCQLRHDNVCMYSLLFLLSL